MVSTRCKMLVKSEMEKLGIFCISIELGEANTIEIIPVIKMDELDNVLKTSGIELIYSKKIILLEKIKNVIIELVHFNKEILSTNFSDYLSLKLHHDYTYLANIFSESNGITIEHFLIMHRIERVKELITYDELTIKQIAKEMNYRNVSHLSAQFKKITGVTISFFKKIKYGKRILLENI